MTNNKLKKRHLSLPFILKLLYVAIFLSTFLTCLILWTVKYDTSQFTASKFIQPVFLTIRGESPGQTGEKSVTTSSTVEMENQRDLKHSQVFGFIQAKALPLVVQEVDAEEEEDGASVPQVRFSEKVQVNFDRRNRNRNNRNRLRQFNFNRNRHHNNNNKFNSETEINVISDNENGDENSINDFDTYPEEDGVPDQDQDPDSDTSYSTSLFPQGDFSSNFKRIHRKKPDHEKTLTLKLFPPSLEKFTKRLSTSRRQSSTARAKATPSPNSVTNTSSEVKLKRIQEFLRVTGTQLWKFGKATTVAPYTTGLTTPATTADTFNMDYRIHTLTTTAAQTLERTNGRFETATEKPHRPFENEADTNDDDPFEKRRNLIKSYCTGLKNAHNNQLKTTSKKLRTNFWIRYAQEESGEKPSVNLEWCPIFKAASSPWMALLMAMKKTLSPRTESLIRKGQSTFVNLAKLFHMQVDPHMIANAEMDNAQEIPNISMLIVRHPFDRILSAYRDKLERIKGRNYYRRKFGIPIIRRFRKRKPTTDVDIGVDRNGNDGHLQSDTFFDPEFQFQAANSKSRLNNPLQFRSRFYYDRNNPGGNLVPNLFLNLNPNADAIHGGDASRGQSGMRSYFDLHPLRSEDTTPTFDEFVRFLLASSPSSMDEHWRPTYIDCNSCSHRFDLILKVETMDEDRDSVLNLLGIHKDRNSTRGEYEALQNVWRRWTNSNSNSARSNSNSNLNPTSQTDAKTEKSLDDFKNERLQKVRRYFSQVSEKDLKSLYEIYKPDFLMFGYSPQEFFEMAKKS